MKRYQPIVLQKLAIRIPGIAVRQLALHRHLPETTDVTPHAHNHCQCLLYLSGRGEQQIGDTIYPVGTGTAVFLPPRVRHAFHREANRRPICLVIDFDWRGAKERTPHVSPLPFGVLREVRQDLARLVARQRGADAPRSIHGSVIILRLLDCLLAGTALQDARQSTFQSSVARKLDRLLGAPEAVAAPLHELARRAGYQHDYLNRLLRQHEGLTLGQLRAQKLLVRAQHLLRQRDSIAVVADAVGFGDPNYFTRWFRRQTGLSPSRWRLTADA